jgi:hypothetical protein
MTHFFKKTLMIAGFSALIASQTLSAQHTRLIANVPFSFHAEGRVLPAGNYILVQTTQSGGVFEFVNRDADVAQFMSAQVPKQSHPKESKLVFARYGNDYILTEISVAGAEHTNGVSKSSIEKNLTRKLGLSAMISVPLHAR